MMTTILTHLVAFVIGLGLGIWLIKDPADARKVGEAIAARVKGLFHHGV